MKRSNNPDRQAKRRNEAADRQAKRDERSVEEQLAVLAERGHADCREAKRLRGG